MIRMACFEFRAFYFSRFAATFLSMLHFCFLLPASPSHHHQRPYSFPFPLSLPFVEIKQLSPDSYSMCCTRDGEASSSSLLYRPRRRKGQRGKRAEKQEVEVEVVREGG